MNLDIETTVRTIFFLLIIAALFFILMAMRAFREASRLRFFLKKRALLGRAWQFIFFAILILICAFLINNYAEPFTYRIFQPSPTPTQTATITSTPTITLTPTMTQTPTNTPTLEFTPLPLMPAVISEGFISEVTPNPQAIFSNISFSRRLTQDYLPIDPADTFRNPINELFASFSYDKMLVGSQWSALWFRNAELIYFETKPWNGASGGYGFSDCLIAPEDWLPGIYEVQIFVGETWKASGTFTITGEPPTPTATNPPTATITATVSLSPTSTLTPSETPEPTSTPQPSFTVTQTAIPTRTSTPTRTPAPTRTPTKTPIPTATLVPTPTRYSTIFR